jgi:LPXTG-motif cell wall-anchored protein
VLPSTGEKTASAAVVLGAVFAIGAGLLGAARLLRRKKL